MCFSQKGKVIILKKKLKWIIPIFIVLIIISVIIYNIILQRMLNVYVKDLNNSDYTEINIDTYTPTGISNSYINNSCGWDPEIIWIYKLNNKENEFALKNISEDDNWYELSETDYELIRGFYRSTTDSKGKGCEIDFQNSFYCVYDFFTDDFINVEELSVYQNSLTYSLFIFMFDATNQYYYAIRIAI